MNFDVDTVRHTETNEKVKTDYDPMHSHMNYIYRLRHFTVLTTLGIANSLSSPRATKNAAPNASEYTCAYPKRFSSKTYAHRDNKRFIFIDSIRIFGYEGQAADDIIYVNWLLMVRAGVVGLEFFSPETKIWRQVCIEN